jgi:hypothetical protein
MLYVVIKKKRPDCSERQTKDTIFGVVHGDKYKLENSINASNK